MKGRLTPEKIPALVTLRYRLKSAKFDVAEEAFEVGGQKFNRGSFIIQGVSADEINKILTTTPS